MLLSVLILGLLSFLLGQWCVLWGRYSINVGSQLLLGSMLVLSIILPLLIPYGYHASWQIMQVNETVISLDIQFDQLTWVMMCSINFISLMIHSYSARYLLSDNNQARFMSQLSLLTSAVLFLVMSGSLLTAFIAWQFIGLSLYLLLNHYHYHEKANKAAKKKFIINRVGDICFLLAVLLTFNHYGTTGFHALMALPLSQTAALGEAPKLAILGLVFVAVMTKSAQFPFHLWLIDTMEAPTPVSALMHAGVINSGGFLLARLSPWYSTSVMMLSIIFAVGLCTALLGKFFMRTQPDVKKQLAYSTMGQMGYMVMQCGLGCFSSAVFHLIAHGFFKSTLFLNSGSCLNQSNVVSTIKPKVPMMYRVGYMLLSAALILLGCYGLAHWFNQASLSSLIWVFIGFSLFELCYQQHKAHNAFKLSSLVLIIAIYIIYLSLLGLFIRYNVPVIKDVLTPLWLNGIGLSVIAVALVTTLLLKALPRFHQYQLMSYARSFHKADIERFYRDYLLNPTRRLGDRLLQLLGECPQVIKIGITLFLLALAGSSFYFTLFTHGALIATMRWLVVLMSLVVLIAGLLVANRLFRLKYLLLALITTVLMLSNLGMATGEQFAELVSYYYAINMALILFAFALLLVHRRKGQSLKALTHNQLPWYQFYISVLLMLLIGIPGTASFISEFYILQSLMSMSFVVSAIVGFSMLLLALVVLHTLQVYCFSAKAISNKTFRVTPSLHMVSLIAIVVNVVNGIQPQYLINLLATW